jgi:NAD(P)-dependent dehydrogenase (short-subunit alcohol dehydrogenase family)
MDLELSGKRALVTGGSRGIGKAIARQLAFEGVDCVICARNLQPLEDSAKELASQTGRKVVPIVADTLKPESIAALVRGSAAALGGIDILVNNAARVSGDIPEDFDHIEDQQILKDFEEKVVGYFRCAREVAPYMRQTGWGRIVNVSGLAARSAGGISAGARNVATVNLTKSLSMALGPEGITVNAVYPAGTLTENLRSRMSNRARQEGIEVDQLLEQSAANTAIRRLVTAEDIANVVVFLCSPKAEAVTGEAIAVTGGVGSEVHY